MRADPARAAAVFGATLAACLRRIAMQSVSKAAAQWSLSWRPPATSPLTRGLGLCEIGGEEAGTVFGRLSWENQLLSLTHFRPLRRTMDLLHSRSRVSASAMTATVWHAPPQRGLVQAFRGPLRRRC
jgi:hypothetical protein